MLMSECIFAIKDEEGRYIDEQCIWIENGKVIYYSSNNYTNGKILYHEDIIDKVIDMLKKKMKVHNIFKQIEKERVYI